MATESEKPEKARANALNRYSLSFDGLAVMLCAVFSRVLRWCALNAASPSAAPNPEGKSAAHAEKESGKKEMKT